MVRRKPPGKCIFCGQGNLSKEHVWPQWASALLPTYVNNRVLEQRITVVEKATLAKPPEFTARQGHTWTKKIRAVCVSCNNGWMSLLESAAKPILTPLIASQAHRLTVDAMHVLAQWMALKVMVAERNHPEDAVTPLDDCAKFKRTREIPPNFKIWITKCGLEGWRSRYFRHAATVSTISIGAPQHRLKNIHSVAFCIGDLFVLVLHTTVEGVLNSNPSQPGPVVPLFPVTGPCDWPPPRSLSADEARALADTLGRRLRDPKVPWRP